MMMTNRIIFFTLIASFVLHVQDLSAQAVRFNEVLPSNKYTLQDEDGDYPDWFELKNTGSLPVDLGGYSVTDNQYEILKWTFPEYILPPGGFIVVYASGKDRKTIPQFYNTIIREGDTWRYIIPKSEIPGWTDIEFNDTNWPQGPSGFGYADNDDATILPQTISVFLRKSFLIDDTSDVHSVVLHIDFDDGFVAYLNGIEIARSNIGTPGIRPSYNQTAITYREAEMYLGGFPEKFPVDNFKGLIKPGVNVLAIQVHNSSLGSSDFSAIPFLTLSGSIQPEITPPSFISEVSGGFHSNFKISAGGDSIYLYDPSGIKMDEFFINIVPSDISLGYKPGDYSSVFGFTEPSPWRENLGEPLLYSNPDPLVFYPAGGHYLVPLNLSITSNDQEDSIFYTTDGSEPTRDDLYYTGEITVDKTISIRARAFRTGKIPGETATHSYLIGDGKEIPIVFISTDPANLFDNETGIYVKGSNAQNDFPYFGANFWNDWEIPAHVEYYNYQNDQKFSIDAGIKIYGAYSRGHPQKSLSIFARSKYGDKSINARLFTNSSLEKYEAIILRNSGNDWFGEGNQSGVLFRDLFMTSVGRDIGIDAQAGRPVVVYINGQYWGIQNMREKINEHFVADNH
ncbi:MAG: CotH kinase family protein, partial [Bacteroidales bacterium]|nr:CotH kinase family protein [Bacteroidales bacterium]